MSLWDGRRELNGVGFEQAQRKADEQLAALIGPPVCACHSDEVLLPSNLCHFAVELDVEAAGDLPDEVRIASNRLIVGPALRDVVVAFGG